MAYNLPPGLPFDPGLAPDERFCPDCGEHVVAGPGSICVMCRTARQEDALDAADWPMDPKYPDPPATEQAA